MLCVLLSRIIDKVNLIYQRQFPEADRVIVGYTRVFAIYWNHDTELDGITESFIDYAISHEFHVSEISAYILHQIQVIIISLLPFIIKWFYRYAIIMLEQGV